jgi:hypothetical protein
MGKRSPAWGEYRIAGGRGKERTAGKPDNCEDDARHEAIEDQSPRKNRKSEMIGGSGYTGAARDLCQWIGMRDPGLCS